MLLNIYALSSQGNLSNMNMHRNKRYSMAELFNKQATRHYASYSMAERLNVARCGAWCWDGARNDIGVRDMSMVNCPDCVRITAQDIEKYGEIL